MAWKSKKQSKLNRKGNWHGGTKKVNSTSVRRLDGTHGGRPLEVVSKECSGKNGYLRRNDAKKHARRVPGNRVYKCRSCKLFHVGHSTAVGRQQMREVERGEHARRESCTLRE